MNTTIPAAGSPAAPGGLRAAGTVLRAAVYIDGFNLYHAIDDLGAPHLKWVNLRALSGRIIRKGEGLARVVWCSAANTKNTQKLLRWRAYKKAQESVGVVVMQGHFTEEPRRCDRGHSYFHPTEKEGDVNLAISLISDAHLGLYDVAYLVTADSDQVATAKLFRVRFPDKQIISVAPPGRRHSKEIIASCHDTRSIRRDVVAVCFPARRSSATAGWWPRGPPNTSRRRAGGRRRFEIQPAGDSPASRRGLRAKNVTARPDRIGFNRLWRFVRSGSASA